MTEHLASDHPDGAELLAVATHELLAMIPAIPREHQLTARLILKAMKIARAEMTQTLPDLPDGLAAQIRAGQRDLDPELPTRLRVWVEARLTTTNPRYLERARALKGGSHDH